MKVAMVAMPSGYKLVLYPTYDVDQSTASVCIRGIALWLGQYHDIALWLGQYHDIALRGQLETCRIRTSQAGQYGVNALVHNHKYIQHLGFALMLYVLVVTHSCIIYSHAALLGVH